jgi:outer membrane lipoprotein-sorting protein
MSKILPHRCSLNAIASRMVLKLASALALLTTIFFCTSTSSFAQTPGAEEIVRNELLHFYQSGKDFQAKVVMRLINAQGTQRERSLNMFRLNVGNQGDQRYLMTFEAPADVRGLGFMVWKYSKKDSERWLYFPALKAVKRVAADDKRSSFVGSDFTYEDISGRGLDEEKHVLLRQENMADRPTHVIESRPNTATTYKRRLIWIDRERWLPIKEEYYDTQDKLQRTFKADKVEQINGHWTVTQRSMHNAQTGGRTEVVYQSIRYDTGLVEDLFAERSLRNPPALQP